MDKIEVFSVENLDGVVTEFVIIDRGNGEFTSMTKATYDAQQATLVSDSATPQA
jgi:hypothetical protein